MSITYSQSGNGRYASPHHFAGGVMRSEPPVGTAECSRTTVVIIERRELIRDCLARALRATAHYEAITLSSLKEWFNICERSPASVIVLSASTASERGQIASRLQQLSQARKALPIIVLADGEELTEVLEALNNGAKGYIPTNLSLDVVVEAIRLVNAGGVFVPASCLATARDTGAERKRYNRRLFTARQAAVVEGIRKGKANKMIAYELNLQESTVKVHIRNIMKKLNAKNRTEVAYITNNLESTGDL